MKNIIINSIIVLLITIVISEVATRTLFVKFFPKSILLVHGNASEDLFWTKNDNSGWYKKPNSSGYFTDGIFSGHVTNDGLGNRLNSDESTFNPKYDTIFFLGDSTTASLEANNNETVPARLEQKLRSLGLNYNVLNLGVRGYGTAQSYWRAMEVSKTITPKHMIYLYTDNDTLDNNSLKFSKYNRDAIYKNTDGEWERISTRANQWSEREVILFDEKCRPHPTVYIGNHRSNKASSEAVESIKDWLTENVILYRLVRNALRRYKRIKSYSVDEEKKAYKKTEFDHDYIYREISSGKSGWQAHYYKLYMDQGSIRKTCSSYFDQQYRHLINKIRQVPGVQSLHVALFPMGYQEDSTTRRLFEKINEEGAVKSFIDLSVSMHKEKLTMADVTCHKGEPHFCNDGNMWIADHILQTVRPHL